MIYEHARLLPIYSLSDISHENLSDLIRHHCAIGPGRVKDEVMPSALACDSMAAVLCRQYGGPQAVSVGALPKPVPGPDEIRVRVMASPITVGDRRIRSLDFPQGMKALGRAALGWRRLRNPVLGAVFAGQIDALGKNVHNWQLGDAVFGMDGLGMGCHAAYKLVNSRGAIAPMPDGLSFEGAAALPFGGLTAMHFLRAAHLRPGERLLVNGAAGACGAAALQLAVAAGSPVTAVCSSRKLAWARQLGATDVLDYTDSNVTQLTDQFDVIVDTAGNHGVADMLGALKPGGRLVRLNAGLSELWLANRPRLRQPERRVIAGLASERASDLLELASMVSRKQIRPQIDSVYCFEDAVMAHARADASGLDGAVLLQFD